MTGEGGLGARAFDVGRCSACSGSSRALSCTPCARTEREKAPILNETDDEAAKTAKSPVSIWSTLALFARMVRENASAYLMKAKASEERR